MSKQNIEIEVPDGFVAKYNPETQKIEMVKKHDMPLTWEDFCKAYPVKKGEFFIDGASNIKEEATRDYRGLFTDRNLCASKEESEAFLALIQLRRLHKAWKDKWKTDGNKWGDDVCIAKFRNEEEISIICTTVSKMLSFPTKEIAKDFLHCFKDLIETAKVLL